MMRLATLTCSVVLLGAVVAASAPAQVTFTSPGLPVTTMDAQGRVVEDWGAFGFAVTGEGFTPPASVKVEETRLDQVIPGARAVSDIGGAKMTVTAFRGPAFPAGLDVVTVVLNDTTGKVRTGTLLLDLPAGSRSSSRTVKIGGRAVVMLPEEVTANRTMQEWGYDDEAIAMPGWARPEVACDPAFRNIRAGMEGVPISYRFKVTPGASLNVVLGFCESHWEAAGQRPMVCQVEGAPLAEVDPIAQWGRHRPGALVFAARDTNSDGLLDVSVLPQPGAPDQNPILNVIWLFAPGAAPNLNQVIAGRLNAVATRMVDVGGANDQPLYLEDKLQYPVTIPANGSVEMSFLVACPGATVPTPAKTAWTPERLRKAALSVWHTAQNP